jgi:hypothetical protein
MWELNSQRVTTAFDVVTFAPHVVTLTRHVATFAPPVVIFALTLAIFALALATFAPKVVTTALLVATIHRARASAPPKSRLLSPLSRHFAHYEPACSPCDRPPPPSAFPPMPNAQSPMPSATFFPRGRKSRAPTADLTTATTSTCSHACNVRRDGWAWQQNRLKGRAIWEAFPLRLGLLCKRIARLTSFHLQATPLQLV